MEGIDRLPDHSNLKRNLAGSGRKAKLGSVFIIGVSYPRQKRVLHLLLPRDAPLAEISDRVVQKMRKAAGSSRSPKIPERVFLTVDRHGERSPGKSGDLVGDRLQDGQLLHVSYGLYHKRGVLRWRKEHIGMPSKDEPCAHCQSPETLLPAHSGFRLFRLCERCLEKSRAVVTAEVAGTSAFCQDAPGAKTYTCVDCGEPKAALHLEKELLLKAKCVGPCSAESTEHRCCQNCDLPLDRAQKCGRCRAVLYCSAECQQADWPRHKPECVEK